MEKNENMNITEMQQPINLCRCCLAEGCYKDISTEYFTNGQKEVYAAMLLETFNLNISYQEGGGPSSESRLICDDCITRLRDSYKFKKMVLHSEETFKERLERLRKPPEESTVEVKLESLQEGDVEDGSSDDFNMESGNDDVYIVDDSLSNIKIEGCKTELTNFTSEDECQLVIEEQPAKKRRSNRRRIYRTEEGQIVTRKSRSAKEIVQNFQEPIEPSCSEPVTKGERKETIAKPHRSRREELMKKAMIKEMNVNTLKLIRNSNLTLFTWTKRKYRCFYCEKCFVDMATLKQHSSTHTLDEIDSRIGFVRQTELKKAEISNLACRLCPSSCKDLNDLIHHLNVHNIVFKSDSHLLIPYRLENGKFECVFCEKSFQVYVKLSSHMNCHYQNYVCEICGAGFANRLNLSLHVRNSHYPTKCSQCDRMFKNLTEKSKHRAKEHNVQSRRFCPLCNEILPNAYAKLLHMNSAHGVKFPEHKCNHCDRIFKTRFFLNTHVRRQHLEEKNHVCDKCSMRFYTTADLKRHFKCHDSRKSFSCSYCDTMFKTKDSWRRHLKRTHNKVDSNSQCYSLNSSNP